MAVRLYAFLKYKKILKNVEKIYSKRQRYVIMFLSVYW